MSSRRLPAPANRPGSPGSIPQLAPAIADVWIPGTRPGMTSWRHSDELEHLGLGDPPAGAVAGAVHGADRARLCELRPAARDALSQYRRADRAGARLPVGRGALRAR